MDNKIRKIITSEFIVTRDHLDSFLCEDYNLIEWTDKKINEYKAKGFTIFTQCYDDDDILYYSGYVHEDADEFAMIDWAMYDSGCTYCKQRSPSGKMEHL